ncbi:MAG: methionine adenosyltransferase [Rhodospirillaceae bacterium]|nr:methionine adenosyltransferase [Rhodospirillaceae bacterium]
MTIFTSESVTPGHPDKLCDQISDAAVDAFLRQDPQARVVAECAVATGVVFLAARYAAHATVDLPALARRVIADVGYRAGNFDARSCSILTSIADMGDAARALDEQDLADADLDKIVSDDQANIFGFACDESPTMMPLPIVLAHRLAQALTRAREDGAADFLAPDGKTQVSVEYEKMRPARLRAITLTTALGSEVKPKVLAESLRALVIDRAFAGNDLRPDDATEININPGGHAPGGPAQHAGLTGRKNGIDTYGEYARQSGAALSGKDPSRIDRTAAYAARHAAKNVVAAGLASRCEVHLAYAIGKARPVSLSVDTFGTGKVSDETIAKRLSAQLDFRPAGIVRRFDLRRAPAAAPQGYYRRLAVFGQMGRDDADWPWERIDAADALR